MADLFFCLLFSGSLTAGRLFAIITFVPGELLTAESGAGARPVHLIQIMLT